MMALTVKIGQKVDGLQEIRVPGVPMERVFDESFLSEGLCAELGDSLANGRFLSHVG